MQLMNGLKKMNYTVKSNYNYRNDDCKNSRIDTLMCKDSENILSIFFISSEDEKFKVRQSRRS